MSTIDYIDYLDIPCRCGVGRIQATCASPDYAFGRAEFYGKITCAACSAAYDLDVWGWDKVWLTNRADLRASREAARKRWARADAFLKASPAFQALQQWLLDGLGKTGTKAGKYRWLSAEGLLEESLSTFRRGYVDDQTTAAHVIALYLSRFTEPPELVAVARQYRAICDQPGPEVRVINLTREREGGLFSPAGEWVETHTSRRS